MEKLIEARALYRKRRIMIPTPEFYVFYNGNEHYPAEEVLQLSDSYLVKNKQPMLNLIVRVININFPENHPVLEACRPLYEYAWFIQQIKEHLAAGKNRDEAIVQAIQECLAAGMMEEFLAEHGTEAVNMLFTEFNMEDALDVRFEEGIEQGLEQGIEQGEAKKLRGQINRKLAKGKSIEAIAVELEESAEVIRQIIAEN